MTGPDFDRWRHPPRPALLSVVLREARNVVRDADEPRRVRERVARLLVAATAPQSCRGLTFEQAGEALRQRQRAERALAAALGVALAEEG